MSSFSEDNHQVFSVLSDSSLVCLATDVCLMQASRFTQQPHTEEEASESMTKLEQIERLIALFVLFLYVAAAYIITWWYLVMTVVAVTHWLCIVSVLSPLSSERCLSGCEVQCKSVWGYVTSQVDITVNGLSDTQNDTCATRKHFKTFLISQTWSK